MSREQVAEMKRLLSTSPPNPFRDSIDRRLFAEVERLQGLLAKLEWAGRDGCPACHDYRCNGHLPDCWLDAELPRGRPVEVSPGTQRRATRSGAWSQ